VSCSEFESERCKPVKIIQDNRQLHLLLVNANALLIKKSKIRPGRVCQSISGGNPEKVQYVNAIYATIAQASLIKLFSLKGHSNMFEEPLITQNY
jgi:hypothetical protein